MKKALLIAVLFCPAFAIPSHIGPPVVAQDPDPAPGPVAPVIVAPDNGDMNTLIVLDATKTDEDISFLWRLPGSTAKNFIVVENGRLGVFTPPAPGRYVFAWAASRAGATGKPPILLLGEKSIQIAGATPGPTPVPPTPEPVPPLPAGRFGLAQVVRDAVLSTIPANKRGPCSALSANFSSVSSQIAAGTVTTFAAANSKVKEKNVASAGPEYDTLWKPGPFAAINSALNALVKAGTVKTSSMQDVQDCFTEISVGFAAAGG